jgi:hypothetical protein
MTVIPLGDASDLPVSHTNWTSNISKEGVCALPLCLERLLSWQGLFWFQRHTGQSQALVEPRPTLHSLIVDMHNGSRNSVL